MRGRPAAPGGVKGILPGSNPGTSSFAPWLCRQTNGVRVMLVGRRGEQCTGELGRASGEGAPSAGLQQSSSPQQYPL